MFNFKNKRLTLSSIKNKLRVSRALLSVTLLVSMLGLMLMPNGGLDKVKSAGVPRFNFMQGDYQMLEVAKTAGGTWSDPVSANVGDRISYSFYYHNGMIDTVAHNTSLRVDLPTITGTKLEAVSWLWSDETAPISDTVVAGQVVGLSGATINTATPARIEYVAGSTNWYPNGSSTPTHLPDGITGVGMNIGDIKGCWQYAGFVTFMVDVKAPAQMIMDKKVGHPGASVDWQKMIGANPGDNIAYQLGIQNNGGTTASGVTVKDILPTYMTYTPGTTYLYTEAHPEGIKQADTLFTNGISLPNVAPGAGNVIYVTYKTKITSNMPAGAYSLNNVAKLFMGGVEQAQSQARVLVTAERGLVIDKMVSNGVSWVEENTAKMGDTVTYRIKVRNTGNMAITNVMIKDALPMFVSYTAGSTKVDGVIQSDAIISTAGLNIGTLNPGQEKVITLSGVINGCAPLGQSSLINTAYGRGDNVVEKFDSAKTVLTIYAPVMPR